MDINYGPLTNDKRTNESMNQQMNNLSLRSSQLELLDAENIPYADLAQNLKELETINHYLGGHSITIKGLQRLISDVNHTYAILDIGSGGGDTLKAIAQFGRKSGLKFKLIGVDLKEEAIQYAAENCKDFPEIKFIHTDYRKIDQNKSKPDIIISSLFCHHLSDEQLVDFLVWMNKNAKVGFIVNDLHRHSLAYHSISTITNLFSKSYLVKNDAKVSVARGFKRIELQTLLAKAKVKRASLTWMWAFRWLIVGRKI
ncbi:methyltransferase domain-containing protein [Solitalea koreensis]|uniref:Methyltransferase domain-containing protein n=1 Tax=Solitalea koreensis TaxID=543615 RepID=A0A521ASB0_9SPHI|nr:methyltransferase domain-containing protein [Solitalea koreensis]SMO37641.1 Methyltransferase domain-containing protein [Solitalea koreensis]